MSIDQMLDEVQRVLQKIHGGGVGVSYKDNTNHTENHPQKGEPQHSFTSYRSRYREGYHQLHIVKGISYEDVVVKMYDYWMAQELVEDAKKHEKQLKELGADPAALPFGPVNCVRYCWSLDSSERFFGNYETELAALKEARKTHPDVDMFVVGQIEVPDLHDFVNGYGSNLVDHLQEQAVEFAGEAADDWLTNVTRQSGTALDELLHDAVVTWLTDIKELPTFFSVAHHKKIQLTRQASEEIHGQEGG